MGTSHAGELQSILSAVFIGISAAMVPSYPTLLVLLVTVAGNLRRTAVGLVVAPLAPGNRWQGFRIVTKGEAIRSNFFGRRNVHAHACCSMVDAEGNGAGTGAGVMDQADNNMTPTTLHDNSLAAEDKRQAEAVATLKSLNEAFRPTPPSPPQRTTRATKTAPSTSTKVTNNIVSAAMPAPPANETLVVNQEDDNAPIDWVLSRRLPVNSRRFYRKAIEDGRVKVNSRTVKSLVRVKGGSTIFVERGAKGGAEGGGPAGVGDAARGGKGSNLLFPEKLPSLVVLYEDDYFVAVRKPAGMVCQPCEAARKGTVLHGLLYHMIQTGQVKKDDLGAARTLSQGIVHRLDRHTSGIMVVAKVRFYFAALEGTVSQNRIAVALEVYKYIHRCSTHS